MRLLAITFYDVVLTVHILAVVVAFGITFAYGPLAAFVRGSQVTDLVTLHRFQLFLSQRVTTPAMVVVLVAGLYLALDRFNLADPWISATFVVLFALFGLVGGVFIPSDRRCVELLSRDFAAGSTPSEEYESEARKQAIFGAIAGLLIVVAIFLMVAKPGA